MTIKEEVEALKSTNEHLASIIDLLNSKIDYLIDYQTNDWEIKNNQMIIYSKDGNILEAYNLFNAKGKPTNANAYKRIKQ